MLLNTEKMAHFSFTYGKVSETDSLQPSGCNGPLFLKKSQGHKGSNNSLINIKQAYLRLCQGEYETNIIIELGMGNS